MNQNQMVFIVDAGNTLLKVGVFLNCELQKTYKIEYSEITVFKNLLKEYKNSPVFISSVLSEKKTQELLSLSSHSILFNRFSTLPITIKYKTPLTLGLDRICNAVASYYLSNSSNSISIDIGTCVKFDFVDKIGNYLGGSISPGIHLRYKSLNDYTGNLPLLSDCSRADLIGNSTLNSIKSGVMNGIQSEINQFISQYSEQYQDLTIFVTGGDAVYFEFPSKNNTFVEENFTLKGLYKIYLLNAK